MMDTPGVSASVRAPSSQEINMKTPLTLTLMAATLSLGALGTAQAAMTETSARTYIPVGVEESTDPSRIAEIEQRADDLKMRQSDMSQQYEATGAGKARHHKHHARKHPAKDKEPANKAMQTMPDQPTDMPAR